MTRDEEKAIADAVEDLLTMANTAGDESKPNAERKGAQAVALATLAALRELVKRLTR